MLITSKHFLNMNKQSNRVFFFNRDIVSTEQAKNSTFHLKQAVIPSEKFQQSQNWVTGALL